MYIVSNVMQAFCSKDTWQVVFLNLDTFLCTGKEVSLYNNIVSMYNKHFFKIQKQTEMISHCQK